MGNRVTVFLRPHMPVYLAEAARRFEEQHPGEGTVVSFMVEVAVPQTEDEKADELLTLGGNSAKGTDDGSGVPVAAAFGAALAAAEEAIAPVIDAVGSGGD